MILAEAISIPVLHSFALGVIMGMLFLIRHDIKKIKRT